MYGEHDWPGGGLWEERIEHDHLRFGGPPMLIRRRLHGHGPWRGKRHMRFWMSPGRPGGPFGGRGPFPGGPFGGGPFGDDPFGEGGGGRRRQRRGDIKFALLELIAEQPRHGYELIKELEQRYAGFYRPSPGSVYPTLQLLEDEGSIVGEQQAGKRVYSITDAGRRLIEERQAAQQEQGPWRHGGVPGGGTPELAELRRSAEGLFGSVMQVARHGSVEQRRAAMAQLDTARRAIYQILAGDGDQTV